MNNEYQSVGIGLYIAGSIFDHSCDPNSVIVFNGKGNKDILMTINFVLAKTDNLPYNHAYNSSKCFRTYCSLCWK